MAGEFIYMMTATETPISGDKSWHPDEVEGIMARSTANFCGRQTLATVQANCLRSALAVYPLRK